MSTPYAFSKVSDKGFISLEVDLTEGEWAKLPGPSANSEPPSLLEMNPPRAWKHLLVISIATLVDALGLGPDRLAADQAFDTSQRQLHHKTALDADDPDPEIRAAAQRVRAALLLGQGTAQTNLSFQEEVDFGLKQLALASRPPLKDDCDRLQLAPLLARIEAATFTLARAIGRPLGQPPQPDAPRSVRIRSALSTCASTCRTILNEIDLFTRLSSPNDQRILAALRAPLDALLSRYASSPPRASTDDQTQTP
jgi:hypothetical protein